MANNSDGKSSNQSIRLKLKQKMDMLAAEIKTVDLQWSDSDLEQTSTSDAEDTKKMQLPCGDSGLIHQEQVTWSGTGDTDQVQPSVSGTGNTDQAQATGSGTGDSDQVQGRGSSTGNIEYIETPMSGTVDTNQVQTTCISALKVAQVHPSGSDVVNNYQHHKGYRHNNDLLNTLQETKKFILTRSSDFQETMKHLETFSSSLCQAITTHIESGKKEPDVSGSVVIEKNKKQTTEVTSEVNTGQPTESTDKVDIQHTKGETREVKIQALDPDILRKYSVLALQKSNYTEVARDQEKIYGTAESAIQKDEAFQCFLSSLDVDDLNDRLINFGKDAELIKHLQTDVIDYIKRELPSTFGFDGDLVRIGSCEDGSKVGNVNELNCLYVINTKGVTAQKQQGNNYQLTLEKKDLKPGEIQERLGDAVEKIVIDWEWENKSLIHGGYLSTEFSGVRYSGPAVTLLMIYKQTKGRITTKRPLSVDITAAFHMQSGAIYGKIKDYIQRTFHEGTKLMDILKLTNVHLVPNALEDTWFLSTAQIEAGLFRDLPDTAPVKVAFSYVKIIVHDMTAANEEDDGLFGCMTKDVEDKTESLEKAIVYCYRNHQRVPGNTMRQAHAFLSKTAAEEIHELGKSDISPNTAALKHILLSEALKDPRLFTATEDKEALEEAVYSLVVKVSEVLSQQQPCLPSVQHALLDEARVNVFAVSKRSLLNETHHLLQTVMILQCQEVYNKLNVRKWSDSEQPTPEENSLLTGEPYTPVPDKDLEYPEYTYEIRTDLSIPPYRNQSFRHALNVINGLMNACGGIVKLRHNHLVKETTVSRWLARWGSTCMDFDIKLTQAVGNYKFNILKNEQHIHVKLSAVHDTSPQRHRLPTTFSVHEQQTVNKAPGALLEVFVKPAAHFVWYSLSETTRVRYEVQQDGRVKVMTEKTQQQNMGNLLNLPQQLQQGQLQSQPKQQLLPQKQVQEQEQQQKQHLRQKQQQKQQQELLLQQEQQQQELQQKPRTLQQQQQQQKQQIHQQYPGLQQQEQRQPQQQQLQKQLQLEQHTPQQQLHQQELLLQQEQEQEQPQKQQQQPLQHVHQEKQLQQQKLQQKQQQKLQQKLQQVHQEEKQQQLQLQDEQQQQQPPQQRHHQHGQPQPQQQQLQELQDILHPPETPTPGTLSGSTVTSPPTALKDKREIKMILKNETQLSLIEQHKKPYTSYIDVPRPNINERLKVMADVLKLASPLSIIPDINIAPDQLKYCMMDVIKLYDNKTGFGVWFQGIGSINLNETTDHLYLLCYTKGETKFDLWSVYAERTVSVESDADFKETAKIFKWLSFDHFRRNNWMSCAHGTINLTVSCLSMRDKDTGRELTYPLCECPSGKDVSLRLCAVFAEILSRESKDSYLNKTIHENLLLNLTYDQSQLIINFGNNQLNFIEGPPGSGKSVIARYLCDMCLKQWGVKPVYFCASSSLKEILKSQGKSYPYIIDSDTDPQHCIQVERGKEQCLIVDDAQSIPWSKKKWLSLLRYVVDNNIYLYVFSDHQYQDFRKLPGANLWTWLVDIATERRVSLNKSHLTTVHRNSQKVIAFIGASFADRPGVDSSKITCGHGEVGDDVPLMKVSNLLSDKNDNGLLLYIQLLMEEYEPRHIAVIIDNKHADEIIYRINHVLRKYMKPKCDVHGADVYPRTGIVVDRLDNFVGIDAPVCVFPIPSKTTEKSRSLDNPKYRAFIASRAVFRLVLLQSNDFNASDAGRFQLDHHKLRFPVRSNSAKCVTNDRIEHTRSLPDYSSAEVCKQYHGQRKLFSRKFKDFKPWGVTVCPVTGHVIVIDIDSHKIHVLTGELQQQAVFGGPGREEEQYDGPRSVCVNSRGDSLYISDTRNNRVQVTDLRGRVKRVISQTTGAQTTRFSRPQGLTIRHHELYVCDLGNRRVVVMSQDGEFHRKFSLPPPAPGVEPPKPREIAASSEEELLAVIGDGDIYLMTPEGAVIHRLTHTTDLSEDSSPPPGVFGEAVGVCFDAHKHLILTSWCPASVHVISDLGRGPAVSCITQGLFVPRGVSAQLDHSFLVCNFSSLLSSFCGSLVKFSVRANTS